MALPPISLLLFAPVAIADESPVDFASEVRPILAESCFPCHGPDDAARQAGLRLDTAEGARRDLGGYRAVLPDSAGEVALERRILSGDPDLRMPPPDSGLHLTDEQKETLRAWIRQGAEYEEHWAFVAPTRPGVPDGRHPIDVFVEERLEREGLAPAPEAPPHVLLRRLSLDLVGLPPTPAETRAFVDAHAIDPDAAVADAARRLVGSPRFGEKWARGWLDLARYADSNGFQADQLRPSWAWRDWVIRALNDNVRFDRFTVEQLAGDLLPEATLEQRIATGFHRAAPCNVEAGVHAEENRVNQVFDRVDTTAAVWLGVTMECARCHDHKYDPFSTEDYYGLFAYFNNTPLEVELPSGATDVSHDFVGPFEDLPLGADDLGRKLGLELRLGELNAERRQRIEDASPGWIAKTRSSLGDATTWHVLEVEELSSTGEEEVRSLDDGSVLLVGPVPDRVHYRVRVTSPLERVTMFKLEALTHPEIPGGGPGRGDPERTNFVLNEIVLTVGDERVGLGEAEADFSQKGWQVAGAVDGDPKSGWAIAPQFGKDHWITFVPDAPVTAGSFTFELHQDWGRGRVLGRVRLWASDGDPDLRALPGPIAELLGRPADALSAGQVAKLERHFASTDAVALDLDRRIAETRASLAELEPDRTLVMVEMEEARPTHVLERGDYLRPGAPVAPGTPSALHAADPWSRPNRLGLAEWIVDPTNPLTARVAVNRWWAELFGRGIVETQEDFGNQSSGATHPRLLDWLAVELVESGWDFKHVLQRIVTSAAYRRDSALTPEHAERDPRNELYARGPRFRLPADAIRDNALAAAGLLSTKMYGPPVMPHQPPGVWRAVGRNAPTWTTAEDEDRFRRGIYVVWRRAAPYPGFVTFDAPDRASCTVQRPRTNTALQALALLNDPVYVEAALALADRALREAPRDPVARAFELALCRPMRAEEREVLAAAHEERRLHYRRHPEKAAAAIAGASAVYVPTATDAVELAACLHVAHVLLNLDETITKG